MHDWVQIQYFFFIKKTYCLISRPRTSVRYLHLQQGAKMPKLSFELEDWKQLLVFFRAIETANWHFLGLKFAFLDIFFARPARFESQIVKVYSPIKIENDRSVKFN